MSDTAKLIEVFIRIGLVPDSGSHWFLPRLVGMAKAFEYAALGQDIPAVEAERVGLVNKVVPAAELEPTTLALAGKLAKSPTKAIGLIKRTLNRSLASDLDTILNYEAYVQEIASLTNDHREGVQSFLEKRPPQFKGE
jgi:2-(1,2-epoxy-1,2-dihydrophenyl)acetyl-CoA isomerase